MVIPALNLPGRERRDGGRERGRKEGRKKTVA